MPVRFLRTEATTLYAAVAIVLAATRLTGCASPAVGAPCLPEQVPADGFDESEAYIESSSVQCETRVCMVYKLQGAPTGTANCVPNPVTCTAGQKNCVPQVKCASDDDVAKKVYCTCRCSAPNSKFSACSCPGGYSCAPVLEQGSIGVRGSYCVRSDTVTEM
jgi:hypothetical protein